MFPLATQQLRAAPAVATSPASSATQLTIRTVCAPPIIPARVGQPAPGKEPPTFEARLYDVLFKGQNPAALVSCFGAQRLVLHGRLPACCQVQAATWAAAKYHAQARLSAKYRAHARLLETPALQLAGRLAGRPEPRVSGDYQGCLCHARARKGQAWGQVRWMCDAKRETSVADVSGTLAARADSCLSVVVA